jgi:hypothetical protein
MVSAASLGRGCTQPGTSCQTSGFTSTARKDMLGMGLIETTSLAYERSVLATNATAAREHSNICDSITNWCLALVHRPLRRGYSPQRERVRQHKCAAWLSGRADDVLEWSMQTAVWT